jgi:hypothetical protein
MIAGEIVGEEEKRNYHREHGGGAQRAQREE